MPVQQHSLRVQDVINLAAPSTWAASVMPCVLALAISYHMQGFLLPAQAVALVVGAILMQSAVNALNDYADYVKGTDTLENSPDAYDAVIVYGLSPRVARNCGIAFLALAIGGIGPWVLYLTGVAPLLIALVGAVVVVAYSFGPLPISTMPLGEFTSGFVMGGLITLAGVTMQVGRVPLFVLVQALPLVLGIGLIMFTNNGCDIERDLVVDRHTLACMLGQRKTDLVYRIALLAWTACPALLLLAQGQPMGAIAYVLCLPVVAFGLGRQLTAQLGPKQRVQMMAGIGQLVTMLSFAYAVAVLVA